MGVEVYVEANDGTAFGFVGSTEALISMVNTILESAELPIDLDLTQVRTLGPLQANGNAGGGVLLEVSADYDSAIGLIAGVEASDNGALAFDVIPKESIGMGMGGGVMLDVNSNDGDAIGALAGIEANWNYGNGIGAYVVSDAMDGEAMLGGINLIANDNFANGVSLQVQSQAPDSSYLVLAGVMANNNFMGSGIDAWVMGEGEVMVAMTAIQANGNGSDGIYLETDTDYGDSSVWISSTAVDDMYDDGDGWNFMGFALISLVEPGAIEANNNGDNGVNIDSYSNSGEIRLNVEDVTASGNGRRGVW
jgi:hypothetical protein